MSSSGLEQAKAMVSSYKHSHLPTMTPELWRAKKVVDSTLHPGAYSRWITEPQYTHLTDRHWRAGLPSLPHVLLRYVQSGRDSWYAYAGTAGKLHTDTLQPLNPTMDFQT